MAAPAALTPATSTPPAFAFHRFPSLLAVVRQISALLGGLLQDLFSLRQGHVGGVCFITHKGLRLRQGFHAALGGVYLRFGAVHLRGGPVQGNAQLVGLLAVVAVFRFGLFQLGGNQLHLLTLCVVDSTQLGQLILHPGHGCGLGSKGALAGLHVCVQNSQLPAYIRKRGLVFFIALYANLGLDAIIRHGFHFLANKKAPTWTLLSVLWMRQTGQLHALHSSPLRLGQYLPPRYPGLREHSRPHLPGLLV